MRLLFLLPLLLACASAGCKKQPAMHTPPAAVKIVVSADTDGWITPCGCTSNQSGGLLRRGTFLAGLRARGPVVYVDAGGAVAGNSQYDLVKLQAILAGEKLMELSAHNIGRSEASLGAAVLRQLDDQGVPLVSANVRDAQGRLISPQVRIVNIANRRIAFVGVMSPQFASGGLQVDDPRPAILSTVATARGTYDALIVLAYLPTNELEKLAVSLPEADAVVGGPTGQPIPPHQTGPTLLTSATNKGKFLAVIDLSPAESMNGSLVEMNDSIADDPAQQTNLRDYLMKLAGRDFAPEQTHFGQVLPPETPPDYRIAGSESCAKCHAGEYASWRKTGHSHAWQTLAAKHFEVDPECMQCHTTGYGLPGGFATRGRTPERVSVGCESCHGPSTAHVADFHHRTPFKAADQCISCHDHENSPHFDFPAYWSKIMHGRSSGVKSHA
jgi:hypothetical protein